MTDGQLRRRLDLRERLLQFWVKEDGIVSEPEPSAASRRIEQHAIGAIFKNLQDLPTLGECNRAGKVSATIGLARHPLE